MTTARQLTLDELLVERSEPAQRPWTATEIAFLRDHYLVDGATRIARDLDRTFSSVANRARRLGLLRKRRWTRGDDLKLELLWDTTTLRGLSKKLGRTQATIYARAQKLGLGLGCPNGFEYLTAAAERTGFDTGQLRVVLRAAGVKVRVAMARPGPRQSKRKYHYVPPEAVDEAVALWNRSETIESAARRHGVCGDSIRRWLDEARAAGASIPAEPTQRKARWRLPSDLIDRVVAEHVQLMSLRQHEARVRISRDTLARWLATAGIKPRYPKRWKLPASVVDTVVANELARTGCRARRPA